METSRRNFQNLITPQTSRRQIFREDQAQRKEETVYPCLIEGSATQHQPLLQQPAQALRSTRETEQPVDIVRTRSKSAAEGSIQYRRSEDTSKVVELSKIADDLLKLNQAFQESECILLDLPYRKVFRYGDVVFKFGVDVSPFEAKTLQFMETTIIPVPRLYYDCVHSDGTVVIVMKYIEGKLLSERWPTLHPDEKIRIVRQLREILEKMRQYQGHYIGGINNTPAVDIRIRTRKGGPFQNEEQFNIFLRSTIHPQVRRIYHDVLQDTMKTDHNILLTHGDINGRHIIVNDHQTVVAILDWESAGWYPEYWEFVKFFTAIDLSTDWCDHARAIFPKFYAQELQNDNYLDRLLCR